MNIADKIEGLQKFPHKLGLEKISRLLHKLGNPHKELNFIHVAGTNGKGSTCKYLYEILRQAKYDVGLFISPYVEVFNERIQYNHSYITDEDLETYTDIVVSKAKELVSEGMEYPTEFEVITCVSFLYFKAKKANIVVLEVGLGGKYDPTNVITNPIASVITPISLDHVDVLGDSISQIAGEKAGIIKRNCPVIISLQAPEAKEIIAKEAKSKMALLIDTAKSKYEITYSDLSKSTFDLYTGKEVLKDMEISMIGEHQISNAITAIQTIIYLANCNKIKIAIDDIKLGLKKAIMAGRFEVVKSNPYIILDGAHNVAGAMSLYNTTKNYLSNAKILMVVGMVSSKDVSGVIDIFTSITSDFIVTNIHNPRGIKASELYDIISNEGLKCLTKDTTAETMEFINLCKKEYDAIIISGSLYLVGEARRLIKYED